MKIPRMFLVLMAFCTSLSLFTSCAIFGKKDKGQAMEMGKEGQWVYSAQRPSATGEGKRATTYAKRPYAAGEEAQGEGRPVLPPTLLSRLKYKVVVADFQDLTKGVKKGVANLATQELTRRLEESGVVIVLDIEEVKKGLGTSAVSFADATTQWRLRTLFGVQGVVIGKVVDLQAGTGGQASGSEALAMVKLDVLLYDTETGGVVRSMKAENPLYTSRAVGEASQDKAIANAISVAMQGVSDGVLRGLSPLEWTTSVAASEGGKVYLNAGKATGLKVGDELEVYNPGRQIRHPTTGVTLGRLPGTVNGRVKVTQLFGTDAAEATVVSGGNIKSGDMARLAR